MPGDHSCLTAALWACSGLVDGRGHCRPERLPSVSENGDLNWLSPVGRMGLVRVLVRVSHAGRPEADTG